ncbi:MAG: amidohydrolase family protein [Clostridiales bacterium]|nr:amidohydrolase family protein [Clostridiales bacterium]
MSKIYSNSMRNKAIALIAAIALAVPCGCWAAFADDGEEAASVYKNGVVYTVEGENWDKNPQESVAVSADGKILFVGSDEEAQAYVGAGTAVIDLDGKTVFPGFLDSHVHPPGTAFTELFEIDLYDSLTKAQALATIEGYVRMNPDLDSYWGTGFPMGIGGSESDGKGPRKEWLDEICSDKPIILTSNDGHNLWLNSKAFELNGITKDTEHPTGTVQKGADGELWGILTDAFDLVETEREFTDEQFMEAMETFHSNMLGWGYTGANMLDFLFVPAPELAGYMTRLESDGNWKLHTNLCMTFEPDKDFGLTLVEFMSLKDALKDSRNIKLGTAKFFMDGVIEGQTGYLSAPYDEAAGLDPDYVSVPLWDVEKLKSYYSTLMKNKIQIHVHSIGDQATTETIDAMEAAQKNNPSVDARNTIAHLQVVKDSDKTRMGKLGIIASTQPFWHMKEPEWYEYVDEFVLGAERAWKEYPVRSLIDAGVRVAFSGDHPVSPVNNPFWAIETSVTRNLNNPEFYGVPDIKSIDDPTWLLNPAERITVKEAIEAYTINTAYQMYMEDQIGSLKAGKLADMIVVDQDPLKVSPLRIDETEVLATIFGGETVYGSVTAVKNPFEDVKESAWFYGDVMYAYENGLMNGTSTSPMLFSPEAALTRGMVVTVLWRMAGSSGDLAQAAGGGQFSDVAEGAYYWQAVNWAASNGIVSGYGNGKFGPSDNITREQLAAILFRYAQFEGNGPVGAWAVRLDFADLDQLSEWAYDGTMFCYMKGVITGRPGNIFDPKGQASRAECAAMLHRFVE